MKNFFKIGALIGKYLTGTESTEDSAQLKDWIDSKENNKHIFDSINNKEQLSDSLKEFDAFDKDRAWDKFSKIILVRRIRRVYLRWGIAASIVIALSTFSFFLHNQHSADNAVVTNILQIAPGQPKAFIEYSNGEKIDLQNMDKQQQAKLAHDAGILIDSNTIIKSKEEIEKVEHIAVVTPRGGEYKVILDDGTEVWLNADSRMEFPNKFVEEVRKVKLEGEAYFSVAKDANRSFIVNLNGIDIEVLGTEFNISAYADDATIQTTLVEGKLAVNNNSPNADTKERVLTPGRQAEFNKENQTLNIRKVNVSQYTAWKDGRFVFDYKKLDDITKVIGRWYDVDFVFADEDLKNMHFSGEFLRYANIDKVYEVIKKTGTNLKFKQDGRTIEVGK